MTRWGQRNLAGNVIQDKNSYPAIVISTGGSMTDDSAIKNRYSCDESRNLSWVWEYSRIAVTHEYLKCQCEIISLMQSLAKGAGGLMESWAEAAAIQGFSHFL